MGAQVLRKGNTECPRRGGGARRKVCRGAGGHGGTGVARRAWGTTAGEQCQRHPRASEACLPGVRGVQMGVGWAEWEVLVCSEQAENTLHSQPEQGRRAGCKRAGGGDS